MEADRKAVDRGESVTLMEPLLIADGSRDRGALTDLAFELTRKSAGFRRSLPRSLLASLADLVRSMNCYYSNLIEGHDTHPIDIERALKNDYSQDTRKRDLQLEAKAHITVQQWIDGGGLSVRQAITPEGISEIHRRFCELLPEDLLWVEDPITKRAARRAGRTAPARRPGRTTCRGQSRRVASLPGPVRPGIRRLGKTESIVSTAAAHHRLLWMHPFLDGNGRVARLMSHALLLEILDTGAVWSVARGLARNVQQYKTLLANCDLAGATISTAAARSAKKRSPSSRGSSSPSASIRWTSWRASSSPIACARAFCSGLRRKSGWAACPRSPAACWRRFSTAASCRAARRTRS